MNSMTKTALIGAGILSMGALAACQSPNAAKEMQHPQNMHGAQHQRGMTPEQHEQMQRMRAERHDMMKQIRQACGGKTPGAAVQAAAGGRTVEGTCIMGFKADRPARGEHSMPDGHRPMHGSMHSSMHMQRGEALTDAKRAELTRQFDQRLAMQQAVQKACQGKADGAAVQIKAGAQTIDGKCEVRFQPKMPMHPAAPAPAKAM